MNKNLYRVIFNRTRGLLMVVAETARACNCVTSSVSRGHTLKAIVSTLTPIGFALLLAAGAVNVAQAGVVANGAAPGSQQPTIINSANGTPQVNIQAPSAAGVSHNRYSQFDVERRGLILNNSHQDVQTQLGGMVAKNPWLAQGEARVILNEVNSRDPSRLNGFIEVAGRKAEVVIANPAGITCNGCGFINANRTTLTTGQPQMQNGHLTGYVIERGEITISGAGMDSTGQDYTDIIARSVKINARLSAQNLRITTGRNRVDAAHQTLSALQDDNSTKPQLALDVASLGGMYAGKIRLIGTERGVGVHNAGEIGASAGNVTLSADGSIANSGAMYASNRLAIKSHNHLNNSGSLGAGGDLNARAAEITSTTDSSLTAGLKQKDAPLSAGNIILTSKGQLTARGKNQAGSDITFRGTGVNLANSVTTAQNISVDAQDAELRSAGAHISAKQQLRLTNSDLLNNDDGTLSAEKLTLGAKQIANRRGTLEQTGRDDLDIRLTAQLDNQQGNISTNSDNLTISAAEINNQHGTISQAGSGTMGINTATLHGEHGKLLAGGKLVYRGNELQLDNASTTASEIDIETGTLSHNYGHMKQLGHGNMKLNARQTFNNQYGEITSNGKVTLNATRLNNQNGKVTASENGGLESRVTGRLDNRHGQLIAAKNIKLTADQLDNSDQGEITASGADLTIHSTKQLLNKHGKIAAHQNTLLSGGGLDNQNGLLTSENNITLNFGAAELNNQHGEISAKANLDGSAGNLSNQGGLIKADTNLTLRAPETLTINNAGGSIAAGKKLSVHGQRLSGDGKVLSDGDMKLILRQSFNNQARVKASGDLTLHTDGNITNDGLISAGSTLSLEGQNLSNQQDGEISAEQSHLLIAGDVTNRGLIDSQLTHISASHITNTGSGRLYGDHIALKADSLSNQAENNRAATIAARDRLDIGTGVLNNLGHSLIYSMGNMAIGGGLDAFHHAVGRGIALTNRGATIEADCHLQIDINQVSNLNNELVLETIHNYSQHHEAVLAGQTARFDWEKIDTSYKNKYGVHDARMPDGSANNDFYEYNYKRTIDETRVKSSDPGLITAGGNITINSAEVHNSDSRIVAGGQLGGAIGKLNNEETPGLKVITDRGSQTHWFARKKKKRTGGTKTSQGKDGSGYNPAAVSQTISINTLAWDSNSQDARKPKDDAPAIGPSFSPGQPVILPAGQRWEIHPPARADGSLPAYIVRTSGIDIRLPDNSLFITNPAPSARYLVETDPRFTNKKQWLSSDYMMKQLTSDPALVHKRLGDGFYEQRLVRDQLIRLTGHRQLMTSYNNENDQFKALMDAGVDFSHKYQLHPGVALSADQMAHLTKDIVWMVEKTVRLPGGATQKVLVPQVYTMIKQGDLSGDGSLLSGRRVNLQIAGEATNSGTLAGQQEIKLNAGDLLNSGQVEAGKIAIQADRDINNSGGKLLANDDLHLTAGRDLNSASTLRGDNDNRHIDKAAGIIVRNDNGSLELQAGRDININAALIGNNGKESHTQLSAGHDLNFGTLQTTHSENGDWSNDHYRHLFQQTENGSQLAAYGSVALSAGHDINARAASVSAGENLSADAGHNLNITSGESDEHLTEHHKQSASGLFSSSSWESHDESEDHGTLASTFSGRDVALRAGNDIKVSGSNVAGEQDVALTADNDLSIDTAYARHQELHIRKETHSGLMGTGGIGVTAGKQSLKTTDESDSLLSNGSTVGSSQGSLHLSAGNRLDVKGADLIAGHDMTLSGKEVSISATENRISQTHSVEQKQSGLTLALSGSVGEAINVAVAAARASQQESDSRLAALQATKSALAGVQAYQAQQLSALNAGNGEKGKPSVGVMLSAGAQSSRSRTHLERRVMSASTLNAGHDLNITATGGGHDATSGDISISGSQLKAGRDARLDAARDIHLSAAADRQKLEGSNSSSGGSLGVGLTAGSGGTGLTFSASANAARGSEHGNGTTWNETTLDAGSRASLKSGRDTALTGAQVSAGRITANTGRDLTLRSLQDSDRYDSRQQSVSAGASATLGVPGGSASLSVSRDRLHSNYDSVREQTGLFAGDGGFDVTTGRHTQLDGAVIASTAGAGKNRLDTGTLGFSDLHNQADFRTAHQGVSLSSSGGFDPVANIRSNAANIAMAGAGHSGHDEGTTRAAVSDGAIRIRDRAGQQQSLSGLSRDADRANGSIGQIFDKEKEQRRLQAAQLIGEIGGQVSDIARTQGQIAGEQAKRDPAALKRAEAQLAAAGNRKPTPQQIAKQAYNNAMAPFGTGSSLQQALSAATAAVQGLAGGNMAQALSGAAAPYLAEQIHIMTTDPVTGNLNASANLMAHAVLGAVTAQLQDGSALAGAAGASAGEYIAQQLYPGVDKSKLSEEQKQSISALSTLAAGLAGGLASDSSAGALSGAQAGKNAVENNLLFIGAGGEAAAAGAAAAGAVSHGVQGGRDADDGWDTGGACKGTREQCAVRDGTRDGTRGPGHTELPVADKDPTGGKLENPAPEENQGTTLITPDNRDSNGASHTGNTSGAPDTGGTTTVTPVPDGPKKDDLAYLALKGKEAQESAGKLGFDRKIPAPKAPFNSHGQPVFFDGKKYITPDVDSHNVTNGWKMFDRKGKRMGTYDSNLKRIKN